MTATVVAEVKSNAKGTQPITSEKGNDSKKCNLTYPNHQKTKPNGSGRETKT